MLSTSCARPSRLARALCFAVAVVSAPAARAAEDPKADLSAADYDAKMRDIDTQLRNVLNTPTDFCDHAAVEAQNRAYDLGLFEKFNLQRQREKIHPTIKQDVEAVVQAVNDSGESRETPAINAYDDDMKQGDSAAANALWKRMTPWEQARGAERQHNYGLAVKVLAPAADQGDVKAQAELGFLYSMGNPLIGATAGLRDDAQAFKYMRLAAGNGDEGSQQFVAKLYACGIGTQKDLVRSYAWFSLALSQSAVMLNTSDRPQEIVRQRDFIAAQMSRDDIQRAKRLLIQCHKSEYKACD